MKSPGVCGTYMLRVLCVSRQRLPDALSGRMLEWTWHVIFGEPWLSLPPNPARLCPRAPAVCRNRPF